MLMVMVEHMERLAMIRVLFMKDSLSKRDLNDDFKLSCKENVFIEMGRH